MGGGGCVYLQGVADIPAGTRNAGGMNPIGVLSCSLLHYHNLLEDRKGALGVCAPSVHFF